MLAFRSGSLNQEAVADIASIAMTNKAVECGTRNYSDCIALNRVVYSTIHLWDGRL